MSYLLLEESTPVARTPHRCTWCGQGIEPGSPYKNQRGTYEGRFQVDKFHLECNKAAADECASEGGDWEFIPYENERPAARSEV